MEAFSCSGSVSRWMESNGIGVSPTGGVIGVAPVNLAALGDTTIELVIGRVEALTEFRAEFAVVDRTCCSFDASKPFYSSMAAWSCFLIVCRRCANFSAALPRVEGEASECLSYLAVVSTGLKAPSLVEWRSGEFTCLLVVVSLRFN